MIESIRKKAPLILLAEDDDDDQEFISTAFQKVTSKHNILIASNGQELLDYLTRLSEDKEFPCLIVLDLNMPVLNAIQTLEALNRKKKFQEIPKVIFTASDSAEDRERCLSKGATDFFVKPANMSEIARTIETMLHYCESYFNKADASI